MVEMRGLTARSSFWSKFFFFFQAEDGIRDRTVTGVQTCALPISEQRRLRGRKHECGRRARPEARDEEAAVGQRDHVVETALRSEERRVGKSVDLGGRRIIKKKKRKNSKSGTRERSSAGVR